MRWILTLLIPMTAYCHVCSQEQMLRDVDFIENAFLAKYGPRDWKRDHYGWDIGDATNELRHMLHEDCVLSVTQFQEQLMRLFNSARDYHVGVYFHSTEKAFLPFQVRSAEGRYFIVWIDRKQLPKETFPFDEGDELLEFDGRPVAEVVQELYDYKALFSHEETDRAKAELTLTARKGFFRHQIPSGPVTLKIKSKRGEKVTEYQVIWSYTPEKIRSRGPQKISTGERFFDKDMSYTDPTLELCDEQGDSPYNTGAKKSFLPRLGTPIWETESSSTFDAYMFLTDQREIIGYLRIPRYRGGKAEIEELAAILSHFQQHTDMLVIDQLNNPGGNWFYYSGIVSMLTDQALWAPLRQWTITQDEVSDAIEVIEALEKVNSTLDAQSAIGKLFGRGPISDYYGYPVTYEMAQFFLDHSRFIVSEWEAGKTLSDPYPIWGFHKINPSIYTQYTKPILFLINELDFSAADFVPAILQDNERVTLMGSRTSGAGGHVEAFTYPNPHGVYMFRLTGSLAWRINEQPIENLGITPDVPYEITANDRQFGYRDYKAAILKQVDAMLSDIDEACFDELEEAE